MPRSVPIVSLFGIWVFFVTVLIADTLEHLFFWLSSPCPSSRSLGPRLSCCSLGGLGDGNPESFLGVLWASGRSGRPPGREHTWWLSVQGWQWSNCSPVETEIERAQHLHFPLVAFLLILCIWKRQLNANCWLTVFPGMETIWIISMSFS